MTSVDFLRFCPTATVSDRLVRRLREEIKLTPKDTHLSQCDYLQRIATPKESALWNETLKGGPIGWEKLDGLDTIPLSKSLKFLPWFSMHGRAGAVAVFAMAQWYLLPDLEKIAYAKDYWPIVEREQMHVLGLANANWGIFIEQAKMPLLLGEHTLIHEWGEPQELPVATQKISGALQKSQFIVLEVDQEVWHGTRGIRNDNTANKRPVLLVSLNKTGDNKLFVQIIDPRVGHIFVSLDFLFQALISMQPITSKPL